MADLYNALLRGRRGDMHPMSTTARARRWYSVAASRARVLLLSPLLAAAASVADPGAVLLRPFVSGLSSPVEIAHAGDGSNRLFVLEQAGRIRVIRNGALLPTPFLDITGPVLDGGEQGLLGLAFHPDYAANGHFFVFYTVSAAPDSGNTIRIDRFTRSASNPDMADPASLEPVLRIPHPDFGNHNGGKIAFGPDGYLYIAVGDGGGGGDPNNRAQDRNDLLGKLLRIDVDSASPYAIPPTNPFVGQAGARAEVFAFGLRNPWKFSFDRETAELFIGDVGQGAWEEIDLLPPGVGAQNLGWRIFEGTHCFNPSTGCSLAGHAPPILEYAHDGAGGFSVTGGYRYRGHAFRELYGHYVYGDYVSGRIWAALPGGGTWAAVQVQTSSNLSTFGEDEEGELYVANHAAGTIMRLAAPDGDGDGMSDAFESAFFGSATGGSAPADSDGDGIPNLGEYRERTNPAARDNDVFASARLFAMQQYRDFLSREGEHAGVEFWRSQLERSSLGRAQVVARFLISPEFELFIAPVARLYFAYFLRYPDYAGLQHYMQQFRSGRSLDSISQEFASGAEFGIRYGSLDNGGFVNRVYANVLGRAPDAAGFDFWRTELDSGRRTRGDVMLAFSEGVEFRSLSHNEVFVTMTYAGMLRREPDPAGFAFWLDYMDGGNSGVSLIEGFVNSPEYRNRFL